MNLGELVVRSQSRFRDVGGVIVGEETWIEHINAAQRYFLRAARWPFTSTFVDITVTAGVRLVDLDTLLGIGPPTAIDVIQGIENLYDLTNDGPIRMVREDDMKWRFGMFLDRQRPGKPALFKIVGRDLMLIPPPKEQISLRVLYFDDPNDMADNDDEPALPARFQESLIVGACAKASLDDQNFDAASKYQEEFDAIISQALQELIPGMTESVAAAAMGRPAAQQDNLGLSPDRR